MPRITQDPILGPISTGTLIAGIDEAGRGPLAGPVHAAAVILNPNTPIPGLDDSKRLSPARRAELETLIKTHALHWAIATASVAEIDTLNILQATLRAMHRAVTKLPITPTLALVDGNHLPHHPPLPCPARAIIRGDQLHPAISAASILAKEARDRRMLTLAKHYPQYGFEHHKGYPTRAHLQALHRHGVTPHHRRHYAPVRALIPPLSPS